MRFETAGYLAKRMLLPHIQGFLFQMHRQFSCELEWKRLHLDQFVPDETIMAAPLENAQPHLGLSVNGTVSDGRHTWYFSDFLPPEQAGNIGCISLRAEVSTRIEVGGAPVWLSADNGFLCWAEPVALDDGTECYRLNTNNGVLWFRTKASKDLESSLYKQTLPGVGRSVLVHLAESFCSLPDLVDKPWTHFEARDKSGMRWRIRESVLDFGVRLCFSGVAGSVCLKDRDSTLIPPPYDVVWQPDGQNGIGVSMLLVPGS